VAITGAPRFDKRFTTSLIAQSNQELLGEVGRMREMAIKDVETRTGRTVASLLDQLRSEIIETQGQKQGIVSRVFGSLTAKMTDEEKIALTSLTGAFSSQTVEPTQMHERLSSLISMTGQQFTSHIQSLPGLGGNDYILNAALRQSGLMSEVFNAQGYFDALLEAPAAGAADGIRTGYSGLSHTIIGAAGEKFMTGSPFRHYAEQELGATLAGQIQSEVAEKRLFSEIYASRSALGLSSFGSARTYEKTVHLPAVRRLLEAQGYEADEISSMIDYMKRSFAYDASPKLKTLFEEMDAEFDASGGISVSNLHDLSKRIATARIRVLSPDISTERIRELSGSDLLDLGPYQYKFVFSESEAPTKRITGFFADILESELPLEDLDPTMARLEMKAYPFQQIGPPATAAKITSTAQKAQQVARSVPRKIAKATMGQRVGASSAGKAFMSTMASSASGRKVLDLAKSASTLVKQFT